MRIGRHFSRELESAGLLDLQIGWSADGTITYGETVTPAQRAAVEAIKAAHDPEADLADADSVRDAYLEAKDALGVFQDDASLATAKPALLKLGKCVEELLRYLNKRVEP